MTNKKQKIYFDKHRKEKFVFVYNVYGKEHDADGNEWAVLEFSCSTEEQAKRIIEKDALMNFDDYFIARDIMYIE